MEASRNRMVNVLLTPRQQYTIQDLHRYHGRQSRGSHMSHVHVEMTCMQIDGAKRMLHEVHIV